MSRTRPTPTEPGFGAWRAMRSGRRLFAVAAADSLFDAVQLPPDRMVEIAEGGLVRVLVLALKAGGVVRIDNDPPVRIEQ